MTEQRADGADDDAVLRIKGLKTVIETSRGTVHGVDGVDLTIRRGESVALVGESGSGKTLTALSVMRLMPVSTARIVSGEIWFQGEDLAKMSEREMRRIRGSKLALIMQDSLTALNPLLTIGDQVSEPIREHRGLSRRSAMEVVVDVLTSLRIPQPGARLKRYPHQFSGGMRQRVVAGMGMGPEPELIIADEPTTALDATTQAQFLTLMRDVQRRTQLSMLWITHDLGLAAQVCDRVNVMYAGRIVESGSVRRIFKHPAHPYTRALLNSIPAIGEKRRRLYQIDGQPPDLIERRPGCPFAPRCSHTSQECLDQYPGATTLGTNETVNCWHEQTDVVRRSG